MTTTDLTVHPDTGEPLIDIAARRVLAGSRLEELREEIAATIATIEETDRQLLQVIPDHGPRAIRIGPYAATTVTVHRGKRQVDKQACRVHRGALRRAGAATRRLSITWTMPTVAVLDDTDIQARLRARGVNPDDLIIKPVESVAVKLVDIEATA